MNLIVNAADAIGTRGRIDIFATRAGEGVAVHVRDNGPGIPPDVQKRIFDPFFTTKEIGKGTGLGLSICQKIVDGHGGKLSCESMIGEGTEFTIWLPLRQPNEQNQT